MMMNQALATLMLRLLWSFASKMLTIDTWGPFYKHGLTLILAWTSNHMPSKMWDEITYPFLNFNGCTVEV